MNTIVRRAAVAAALLLTIMAGTARAQAADPAADRVRSAVEHWVEGRYKVDEIRRTPVAGIYEVRIGTDLIYVDEKGQHAFIDGSLIDIQASRNLTRERVDELLTINFKDLPLAYAIKQVNGNGKRVLAVFEDPNCGYCRNMRRDMLKLENTTIYTFTLPILAADSDIKAKKAMCAPDKGRAWNDLMLTGKVPDNPGTCSTPVDKVRDLGARLGITATPTVFFTNGKRLRGYVQPAEFEKLLNENSRG